MKIQIILPIVLLVILIAGIGFIMVYNGLVKAEKGIDEGKAQIEAVCQRRLDLIPSLVETVRGYAEHEKQVFVTVTEARSKAQGVLKEINAEKVLNNAQMSKLTSSQSELTRVLKTLFALVENYPDLRASTNFLALQDQLEGTENRISVARQRYNSAVRLYNAKVATFPGNIVARMFGFQPKDAYFEAMEGAEKTVEVKF